jgi:hypothetical protein
MLPCPVNLLLTANIQQCICMAIPTLVIDCMEGPQTLMKTCITQE